MYYKIVDAKTGAQPAAHASNVFGVGPGTSYTNAAIASPLSYFTLTTGLTNGFRLAILNSSGFSSAGAYVSGLLSIGLTPTDLSSTTGFIMHPLTYYATGGYSPNIPATITYNGQNLAGNVLFDTGTPSISIIEDQKAITGLGNLPTSSAGNHYHQQGFYVHLYHHQHHQFNGQNPNISGDYRTIFSIDFFTANQYLTDYTNHQIGLKNN